MKKEARPLAGKAVDSLLLSIEHFNRPSDLGRTSAVLILLDHAFEMLLKSAIVARGGSIREHGEPQTLGFDACVRKAVSDASVQFLAPEQALTLQVINSLRDATQHHLLDISEQHLYIHVAAGITAFRDIYECVFSSRLVSSLPARVVPVSTLPPVDLSALFDKEVGAIRDLLRPGVRRGMEASAKLRALAIVESAMQGKSGQLGQAGIRRLGESISRGQLWHEVFPAVASIELTARGHGPSFDLRITKKEGVPIHLVPEGTPGAAVVAVKRVDELGYYNLGLYQLAEKVGLTSSKTHAVVTYLRVRSDPECYKEFTIGSTVHKRYSQKAILVIKDALTRVDVEQIWQRCRPVSAKRHKRLAYYGR